MSRKNRGGGQDACLFGWSHVQTNQKEGLPQKKDTEMEGDESHGEHAETQQTPS